MSKEADQIALFDGLRDAVLALQVLAGSYRINGLEALARETWVVVDGYQTRLIAVGRALPRYIDAGWRLRLKQAAEQPNVGVICPVCCSNLQDTSACEVNSCMCPRCGFSDAEAGGILI